MYKTKTIWDISQSAFEKELEDALNTIAESGGYDVDVKNSTYSERETNGWGSFTNSYKTVWTAIITYKVPDKKGDVS